MPEVSEKLKTQDDNVPPLASAEGGGSWHIGHSVSLAQAFQKVTL